MYLDNLSILIPTHERYPYLSRLLEYLNSRKTKDLKVIILDSSRINYRETVNINDYNNLDINHRFLKTRLVLGKNLSWI